MAGDLFGDVVEERAARSMHRLVASANTCYELVQHKVFYGRLSSSLFAHHS